jgi:hypothetical protein
MPGGSATSLVETLIDLIWEFDVRGAFLFAVSYSAIQQSFSPQPSCEPAHRMWDDAPAA